MKKYRLEFMVLSICLFLVWEILLLEIAFAKPTLPEKTIVVGCTLPLADALGVETKKTFEMIVDDFNKSGGLTLKGQRYNIKLIIYDDKYTPEGGRAAVERLIYSDRATVLINQLGSGPILAGLTVTEPEKITVWGCPASDKFLTGKKYTFRLTPYLLKDIGAFVYFKSLYPNIKTVVTLGPDHLTGRARAQGALESVEIMGWRVAESIYHAAQETDFSAVATKIRSLNADLVIHAGNVPGTQFGLIMKALHIAGFKGLQLASVAPKMDECLAVSSPEAMEGLYCELPDPNTGPEPTPEAKKVRKLYEVKYGKFDETGFKWVSPWYAWLAAVKKADSIDSEDLQAATAGLEISCPMGKHRMIKRPDLGVDRYADSVRDWNIAQVKGGKVIFIKKVPYQVFINFAEKKYGKKFQ